MAFWGNRVKETTTTTGTGAYSLGGAVAADNQTFVGGVEASHGVSSPRSYDDVPYLCVQSGASGANVDWEMGRGTVTPGVGANPDQLSRDSVIISSNGNQAVDWGAGAKTIILCPQASDLGGIGSAWVVTRTGDQNIGTTPEIFEFSITVLESGNVSVSTANNLVTIDQDGQYLVGAGGYASNTDGADGDFDMEVYVNDISVAHADNKDLPDPPGTHSPAGSYLLNLLANDEVKIYVYAETTNYRVRAPGDNPSHPDFSFWGIRVGS